MTEHRTTADLREYLEAIDLCYFDGHLGDLGVEIRWNLRPSLKGALGLWYDESKTIEIARVCAYAWVPRQFVLQTIFHEGIHAVLGHGDHDHAFLAMEKQFAHTYDVWQWERANRTRLRRVKGPRVLR